MPRLGTATTNKPQFYVISSFILRFPCDFSLSNWPKPKQICVFKVKTIQCETTLLTNQTSERTDCICSSGLFLVTKAVALSDVL